MQIGTRKITLRSLAYARPGTLAPTQRRAYERWLPPKVFWLTALAVAVVGGAAALPFLRARALASQHVGFAADMGSKYNLTYSCYDHYGEGGFRGVFVPKYLNANPSRFHWFHSGNVDNPAADYFLHRRGKYFYVAGRRIDFPTGKNVAVIAPNGSTSFITLSPRHFHYGDEQTRVIWGFTARKRFPNRLNFQALKADNLLPAWAVYRDAGRSTPTWPGTSRPITLPP